jgi:hypothetical protein
MAQNLISADLQAADVTAILESLNTVKTKLPFLSTLQGADIKYLFKVGNVYLPFIDKIYQVVTTHPEILPPVFDKDEFLRDYNLLTGIRPVFNLLNELSEGVQKTYFAASSDAMIASLEVYATVKQNKDKVAGLSVISDELSEFFKKSKAKVNTPTDTTAK